MSDDGEYEDYLYELGWLVHTPLPPHPRPNHVGESVYAEQWSQLMLQRPKDGIQAPNSQLAHMLWTLPARITQRHATVCASVITWLGTSCGQAIVLNGKRFREGHMHHASATYLIAWNLENYRVSCVNGGFRTLEHILAPDDHYGVPCINIIGARQLMKRPELSVEDYETAEHLMNWLGREGTGFLLTCEKLIEERNLWERVKRYERMKGGTT